MKALTFIRPWGWAVVHGFKRIENRVWPPPADLGQFAVHSGKADMDRSAFHLRAFRDSMEGTDDESWDVAGAVIGVAVMHGAHQHGNCRPGDPECEAWGMPSDEKPMWHWEITGTPLREPVPCRGALGLWTLPADVKAAVLTSLSLAEGARP